MKKRLLPVLLCLCAAAGLSTAAIAASETAGEANQRARNTPFVSEVTDASIRVTPTNIQADSVANYGGYGSLKVNGDFGFDEDGEYFINAPARLALIDREGTFLFAYRDDPVGDGGIDTARLRYSDNVVSLTLDTPYISGENPQYYRLDGSKSFPLETTEREYIDEDGLNRHDRTSWLGGPMCGGYAMVIQKLYSSWTNGWAGGVGNEYKTFIMDQNGTVTCELPAEYNKEMDAGGVNLERFSTQRSLGWCGEGLFASYELTVDYDNDWASTTEVLGYMDPTGKMKINLKGRGYIDALSFHENLAAVKNQNGMFGFIDKTGTLVIPCVYNGVGSFCDGLCSVKQNGKWGYIDKSGGVVIPLEYDDAYGAGGGLASVVKDGKCGLVDYNNDVVVPLEYDDISSYEGGAAYGLKNRQVYLITEYVPQETLADGVIDTPFTYVLNNNGSASGYEIQSGRLPQGLTLDRMTGKISGVPQELGVFRFVVKQGDDPHSTRAYRLVIQKNNESDTYSIRLADNTASSTTLSLTNHTLFTTSIRFIVAAYEQSGKLAAVRTVDRSLNASESIDLTVSYGEGSDVQTIKAFALSSGTSAPLQEAWSGHVE